MLIVKLIILIQYDCMRFNRTASQRWMRAQIWTLFKPLNYPVLRLPTLLWGRADGCEQVTLCDFRFRLVGLNTFCPSLTENKFSFSFIKIQWHLWNFISWSTFHFSFSLLYYWGKHVKECQGTFLIVHSVFKKSTTCTAASFTSREFHL